MNSPRLLPYPLPFTLLAGLFLILRAFSTIHAQEAEPYAWKAAAAAADISPINPMWMGGYAGRKAPFETVGEPLHAKALAIEDADGGRFVFITMDLIGVPIELRRAMETYAKETHQLAPERFLINASHTHSGPMIRVYRLGRGQGEPESVYDNVPDEEDALRARQTLDYMAGVEKKLRKIMDEAISHLEPAELSWARARCGFAMNRRTPEPGGGFKNFPNPAGPVDQEVPVLQVRAPETGELRAVLFGYACHATTLNGYEINSDWPGYAQRYFQEMHPGTVAMFLNGCSGDQNPYPRRLQAFAERHGIALATAVDAALETAPQPLEGPLKAALDWPELAYDTIPTRQELQERAQLPDRTDARYAEFLLRELDAAGSLPESYPLPIQVVRFDDTLTLAAIGGEVVVDYSLRLKKELGEKTSGPVWVAGYTNDVPGYIPSDRVLKEGGYEGASSMRHVRSTVHSSTWAPGVEQTVVDTVHRLFDGLK